MFFDKRLTWDRVTDITSYYFMANCYHYVNSTDSKMAPYESDIFNFVKHNSNQVVPIICVDRQLKLVTKDIARNAILNFIAAADSNAYATARRQITDATNAILKMAAGEQLFDLIEESYASYLKIVKNPINELSDEDQILIASAAFALKNKAINSGLVKQ